MMQRWSLLVFAAASWFAVANASGQATPPYKMVDSVFPVDAQLPGDINWIDNDRVLFLGVVLGTYRPDGIDGPNYRRGLLETAHIWDTKRNKVIPYGDSQKGLRNFCSHKGYVSYEWEGKIYAGKFGEEKAVPNINNAMHFAWRNRFSCKLHPGDREFLKWREENKRDAIELLEEHGWLDAGPKVGTVPLEELRKPRDLVLYKNAASAGKEIPIPARIDNDTWVTAYLPWANQYLVIGRWGNSLKVNPAWYLSPDGQVTEIEWPEGEWTADPSYVPTRIGLLVWASKRVAPNSYWRGHYLIKGGTPIEIAPGYFWKGTAVSPDGCKIAFRHALESNDEALGYQAWKAGGVANTLRMINVCEGETK
jgi:hypothetical protein